MNLKEIGKVAHEVNIGNGWEVFSPSDWPGLNEKDKVRFLCTHLALFHTEVAEATEAVRKRDFDNFKEELADTIIRITSVAHGLGIDLDTEVNSKIAVNRTRGLHHGGKAV